MQINLTALLFHTPLFPPAFAPRRSCDRFSFIEVKANVSTFTTPLRSALNARKPRIGYWYANCLKPFISLNAYSLVNSVVAAIRSHQKKKQISLSLILESRRSGRRSAINIPHLKTNMSNRLPGSSYVLTMTNMNIQRLCDTTWEGENPALSMFRCVFA